MALSPWQQRIRRAEKLAAQHSYAAEILGFYVDVARFQESLYERLRKSSGAHDSRASVMPAGLRETQSASSQLSSQENGAATRTLVSSFPEFLSLVEEKAPEALGQAAHELGRSDPNSWPELFSQCWTQLSAPTHPREFLVLAFFQPYAEFTRSRVELPEGNSASRFCPFCHRKPALAILRQQGDGGRRSLQCGVCLAEWDFRRLICAGCGEEDHAKLPVYTAEELPYVRVECCDTCRTYVKCIDLTKNGLADPLVDELASVTLSLWAQERGYAKLQPNLLGL